MAAGDLTLLATAQAWAGPTVTAAMVSAASSAIQNYLCYQVASQPYTRTFNGTGSESLMLPDRPVTAITSLTISGVSIPGSAAYGQYGYTFDDKVLYLLGGRICRGIQNVTITYTAGYAQTPPDIEQACLIMIKTTLDRADREDGLRVQRAGDTEFQYATPKQSDVTPGLLLPLDVLAILAPYRRVAPC